MITDDLVKQLSELILDIAHKTDRFTKFEISIGCHGVDWDEVDLEFSTYSGDERGSKIFPTLEKAVDDLKKMQWRINRKLNRKKTPAMTDQEAAIARMSNDE